MTIIRRLSPHIVNQIAAGEVIERPASVVKELVENAVDADATSIEIFLQEGGKNLILVKDNGKGIAPEDLPLALERHATSKLNENDLFDIRTMGFRGEALPSIASISRLHLISAQKGQDTGWSIEAAGDTISPIKPAAHRQGTTLEVRDLFFATPARLKFLKATPSELNAVLQTLYPIMLANSTVAFRLTHDQKLLCHFQESADAICSARLDHILGRDFKENAINIQAEHDGYQVQGYVSLPTYNKASTASQYFFINGRPVRDKTLSTALKIAYYDVLAPNRFPAICLFLQVPPHTVDVNVHPAKTEVRFQDPTFIRNFISGAVKQSIHKDSFRTSTTLVTKATTAFQPTSPSFFTSAPPLPQRSFHDITFPPRSALLDNKELEFNDSVPPRDNSSFPFKESSQEMPTLQINDTFLLVRTPQGLTIIDQHAAHERILYEKLKTGYLSGTITRQALLVPEILQLRAPAFSALVPHLQELVAFGVVVDVFGENTLVIREVPTLMGPISPKKYIVELADEILVFGKGFSLENKLHEICSTFACHTSVRAGQTLSSYEIHALLESMAQTPKSGQCNHGRPTHVALSLSDIEKLFQRK